MKGRFLSIISKHTKWTNKGLWIQNLRELSAVLLKNKTLNFKPLVTEIQQKKKFSVENGYDMNASSRLRKVLESEYKISQTVPNETDASIDELITKKGFSINTEKGSSKVHLIKKIDERRNLHIFFDIEEITSNPMDIQEMENNDDFEGNCEEQDESLDEVMSSIKVLIEDKHTNKGMIVNVLLKYSGFSYLIDFIMIMNDFKSYLSENQKTHNFFETFKYHGPKFADLDESVQSEFENYFSSLGINNELAEFIVSYSEIKEEEEYRNWLVETANFL